MPDPHQEALDHLPLAEPIAKNTVPVMMIDTSSAWDTLNK